MNNNKKIFIILMIILSLLMLSAISSAEVEEDTIDLNKKDIPTDEDYPTSQELDTREKSRQSDKISSSYKNLKKESRINTSTHLTGYVEDDMIYLSAIVTDEYDEEVDDAIVYFQADGEYINNSYGSVMALMIEGSADIEIPIEQVTNYPRDIKIKAEYEGNDTYMDSLSNEITLKITANGELDDDSSKYLIQTSTILSANVSDEYLYLTSCVIDEMNNPLEYAQLYFIINWDELTDKYGNKIKATVVDEATTICIPREDLLSYPDEINIWAVYDGSRIYSASSSNVIQLNLSNNVHESDRIDTNLSLSAYADEYDIYLSATLTSQDNTSLTFKDAVYFIVDDEVLYDDDGNIITSDVSDGMISYCFDNPFMDSCTFNLKAVFMGNHKYSSCESEVIEITTKDVEEYIPEKLNTTTTLIAHYMDDSTIGLITVITDEYGRWINTQSGYVYFITDNQKTITGEDNSIIKGKIENSVVISELPLKTLQNSNDNVYIKAVFSGCDEYYSSSSDNINLSLDKIYSINPTVHLTQTVISDAEYVDDYINITVKTTYSSDNQPIQEGSVYLLGDNQILGDDNSRIYQANVTDGMATFTLNKTHLFQSDSVIKLKAVYNTSISTNNYGLVDYYLKSTSDELIINNDDESMFLDDDECYNISLSIDEDENKFYLKANVKSQSGKIVDESFICFEVYDKIFYKKVDDGIATCNISKNYLLAIDHEYYDIKDKCIHYYPFTARYIPSYDISQHMVNITTQSQCFNNQMYNTTLQLIADTTENSLKLKCILSYIYKSADGKNISTIIKADDYKIYDNIFYILNNQEIITDNRIDTSFNGTIQAVFKQTDSYLSSMSNIVNITFESRNPTDDTFKTFGFVSIESTDTSNIKVIPVDSISNNHNHKKAQKTQISTEENRLVTKEMVRVVNEKAYTVSVDEREVFSGTIITLKLLSDIFNANFTYKHLIIYLDGRIIFNKTVDDNLEVKILKIIESLIGTHELKIEYVENNQTKTMTENITIK